jgi:O-antigen/teichoic acid export membrane protein
MKMWPGPVRLATALELLKGGVPFFLWTSIVALQPSLEAVLLSKFGSTDAVGWFGASSKLTNLLLFPAVILGSALSPTLARLYATDADGFHRAVIGSLRVTLFVGLPVAMGTFLFAGAGVNLVFGAHGYGPAADNLRILAAYILPVFVNITLGTAIIASRRQLAWTLWKGGLVILGAGASAVLISFTQARYGNGGLGASWITAGAEFAMLGAAFRLLPRGSLDASILPDLIRAAVASAAMALPVWLLPDAPFALTFTAAALTYVAVLAAVGGIGARDVSTLRNTFRGALGRS